MTPERSLVTPLSDVPHALAATDGRPHFGTYCGGLPQVDLTTLGGEWRMTRRRALLERKRWQWSMVATPEVLVIYAVADLGYVANAFLCAVDLKERRPLFDGGWMHVPSPLVHVGNSPGAGLEVRFLQPGLSLRVARPEGHARYRLQAHVSRMQAPRQGKVALDAQLVAASGAPPLTVVAPIPGGKVNITQKWGGLQASGTLEVGGRRYLLDGGVGGMDYTHGLQARHTVWRWANAGGRLPDGSTFGLNLVQGFNESANVNENALWLGAELVPLDRARIIPESQDGLAPWRVTTADGSVDLAFTPVHAHRELRNFKVIRSKFIQVLGHYSGRVRVGGRDVHVEGVPGVAEDQDVLW